MKEDMDFNRMECCLVFVVLKGPFQNSMVYAFVSDFFFLNWFIRITFLECSTFQKQ